MAIQSLNKQSKHKSDRMHRIIQRSLQVHKFGSAKQAITKKRLNNVNTFCFLSYSSRINIKSGSRCFSTSSSFSYDDVVDEQVQEEADDPTDSSSQRVWFPNGESSSWQDPVKSQSKMDISSILKQIEKQELAGGRMQTRQRGVLTEHPEEDMRLLVENYTAPSLASAIRDREEILQLCAELASEQNWEALEQALQPYQHKYVLERRRSLRDKLSLDQGLNVAGLEVLRKALVRMPRRVIQAHQKRAGVVLALCNVRGVPSLLFEKRAATMRAHPDEVCLPGGMVCSVEDRTIVSTCLREMHEEIENIPQPVSVLGVLRCNWGEVHHLVGVAVTPVVCFVGELADLDLRPNPDEVSEVFTVPLKSFLQKEDWIHREGFAPIFVGAPHVLWGLTGYIVERFVKDVLARYTLHQP